MRRRGSRISAPSWPERSRDRSVFSVSSPWSASIRSFVRGTASSADGGSVCPTSRPVEEPRQLQRLLSAFRGDSDQPGELDPGCLIRQDHLQAADFVTGQGPGSHGTRQGGHVVLLQKCGAGALVRPDRKRRQQDRRHQEADRQGASGKRIRHRGLLIEGFGSDRTIYRRNEQTQDVV